MSSPTESEGGAPLCLIVEPSTTVRRIVGRALDAIGPWMTLSTHDAAEARGVLSRSPVLVVTERRLPGTGDLDLVRAIRADAHAAQATIVVLSVRRDAASVREARAAGADTVVFKPVELAVLAERLRGLVARDPSATASPDAPAGLPTEEVSRSAA